MPELILSLSGKSCWPSFPAASVRALIWRSDLRHAAVNKQLDAVDEAAVVGGQKHDSLGNLFCCVVESMRLDRSGVVAAIDGDGRRPGVVQTFTFMAQPHIASGELKVVLADWAQPQHPLYVVYPPNRHLSAKVRVFVDWVAELFKTLAP